MICSLLFPAKAVDAMKVEEIQNDKVNILVVYSGEESDRHPRLQELNLLLQHFTANVQTKHLNGLTKDDLKQVTHLFYIGFKEEELKKEQLRLLDQFKRTLIVIGENVNQFQTFPVEETNEEVSITELSDKEAGPYTNIRYINEVKQLQPKSAHTILLYGKNEADIYPIIVKLNSNRYVVQLNMELQEMNRVFRNYFIDILHDIIPNNHREKQLASIRLEDITPLSDPQPILEIGEYLNELQIPYQLVVSPVYYDGQAGEYYYLEHNEELVEVLQTLADSYGSIVAGGYQREYYLDENAQGIEFWDSKWNQMITNESYQLATAIQSRHDFVNDAAYEQYMNELQVNEEKYINDRIERAVYEFAIVDLYPAAFEAPHYSMSLNGYRLLSHYFEGIIGRVQMGDDMALITNTPVITSANYLYGMTYYPETIGYYNPADPSTIGAMKRRVNEISVIRDGVFGSFFHPYLGLEEFKRFFSVYDTLPNVEWLDLKNEKLTVTTDNAMWYIDDDGEMGTYMNKRAIKEFIRTNTNNVTEYILWIVTFVVSSFIIVFLSISLYLRLTVRKKLFNERRQ